MAKFKFKSKIDIYLGNMPKVFTSPGSSFYDDFDLIKDSDGRESLVKVGEHSIYEEIQSYKESCDLSNILARFVNGETDLLNSRAGFYADVRNMPDNLAGIYSLIKNGKANFDALPDDFKELFNGNIDEFLVQYGTDEFRSKFDGYISSLMKKEESSPDKDFSKEVSDAE